MIAGAFGLVVALAAARQSQAVPLELRWRAPPSCPTGDEVRSEFERLTRVPDGGAAVHLSADARIEQRGDRWVLHLDTVRDGLAGEREVEAASCAPLARAAALVLTLAYQAVNDVRPPAPPPPAPIVVARPPAPSPVTVTGGSAPAVRPSRTWTLAAFGVSGWGPLPGATLGFGAGLEAALTPGGRWSASLRLLGRPMVEAAPQAGGVVARYGAVGAALSACAQAWRTRPVVVAVCAGLQGSALRGASSGGLRSGTAWAPWYAAVPALRVRVPVRRALQLEAGVELATSLNRPRFNIEGWGDIHVVPRLAPTATLGFALDL